MKFVHHRGKSHFDSSGKAIRSVGTTHDISLIHKQQDQLEHMAHHDQLTGLPNRGLLLDRLKQSMQQITRLNGLLAVLFIDLDNFKAINDSFGHDAGDELLVKITQLIGGTMREGDTFSRIGGDEFVVLLYNIDDAQHCKVIMERLLAKVSLPLDIKGHQVSTSVSIGATLYP